MFSQKGQGETSVSNSDSSVLKVYKRGLWKLETLFETLVFMFDMFGNNTQHVSDAFSDTPELPDTPPDTVSDTVY